MANSPNQVNFSIPLATFLSTSVSDGTYSDVIESPKVDSVTAEASDIQDRIGQLWGNITDDFFLQAYSKLFKTAKLWRFADAADRDGTGSDDGLTIDDLCKIDASGDLFYASSVGASSSTWTAITSGGGPTPDLATVLGAGASMGGTTIDVDASTAMQASTVPLNLVASGGNDATLNSNAGNTQVIAAGDAQVVGGANASLLAGAQAFVQGTTTIVEGSTLTTVRSVGFGGTVALEGSLVTCSAQLDISGTINPSGVRLENQSGPPLGDAPGVGQIFVNNSNEPIYRDESGAETNLASGFLPAGISKSLGLAPPNSPSPYDEEFDVSLASFTVVDPAGAAITSRDPAKNQAIADMPAPASGVRTVFFARDIAGPPAALAPPFTLWTRVSLYGPRQNFFGGGVFVGGTFADLSTTAPFRAATLFSQTGGYSAADLNFAAWNGPISGGFVTTAVNSPSVYMGIHVDASNNIWPLFSTNGEGVSTITNARFASPFAIGSYGFFLYTDGNGGLTTNDEIRATFDFFRANTTPIDQAGQVRFSNAFVPRGEINV